MDSTGSGQVGRMAGKRVLVTGAGTGIGRVLAIELAREGAAVALHYSHSCDGAVSATKAICGKGGKGGKAAAFQADLSQIAGVRSLAEEAVRFLDGLDVLVNNAGISMNEPFENVTVEQFDLLYGVNIRAMFFLAQAVM